MARTETPLSNEVCAIPGAPGILYAFKPDENTLWSYQVQALLDADEDNLTAGFVEASDIDDASFVRIFFDDAGNFYGYAGGTTIYKYDSAYTLQGTITLPRSPQTAHLLSMRRSDGTWFYATFSAVYRADNDGSDESSLSSTIKNCRALDFDEENDLLYAVHFQSGTPNTIELYSLTPGGVQNLVTSSGPTSWSSPGRGLYANGYFISRNPNTSTHFIYNIAAQTFSQVTASVVPVNCVAITDSVLVFDDNAGGLIKSGITGLNEEEIHDSGTSTDFTAFRFIP